MIGQACTQANWFSHIMYMPNMASLVCMSILTVPKLNQGHDSVLNCLTDKIPTIKIKAARIYCLRIPYSRLFPDTEVFSKLILKVCEILNLKGYGVYLSFNGKT